MYTRLKIYLFILIAFLALFGLGNTYFWEDEAYNAIFAKNFLETGEFSGWDGRNLLAFRYCTLLDDELRSTNPPLPPLMAAAGFAALRLDTFSGRLPFALLGLLTVPLVYFLTRRAVPHLRGAPVYAAAGLGLSVSFLLYIRQCCYYAPAILFSCLLVFVYQEAIHRKSRAWTLAIALPALLLFYTHYLMAAAALGALAITFLLFDARKTKGEQWFYLAASGSLFAALTVPFALSREIWHRRDFLPHFDWTGDKLTLIWWNFRDFNTANWLPWMLALAGLICFYRARPRTLAPGIGRLIAFTIVFAVGVAILTPQRTEDATFADIRYLTSVLPILAAISGIILAAIHKVKPVFAVALFVVLINTNLLSFAPFEYSNKPQTLLPAYLWEIANPYPESIRAVSDYVLEEIEEDATIMTFATDRYSYPLMFYTGHHVIFGGMLDRNAAAHMYPDFPWTKVDALSAPVFGTTHLPDYFLAFGANKDTPAWLGAMVNYHRNVHGMPESDGYRHVDTVNVFFGRTHRPEIFWRKFSPVREFNPDSEAVYVFKRISKPETRLTGQLGNAAPAAPAVPAAPAASPTEKPSNGLAESHGLRKDTD